MLGKIIKELRKDKGITQEELGKIIGVTTSMVGMYETNARKPSYEVLSKIAEYFDVSTDYLLGKTPFKNESEAYYSISIASIKYLLDNKEEIPEYYSIDAALDYMYENKVSEDMINYCSSLLHKFDNNLHLTKLELFELSNIIFSEIKWTKDYDGVVYLKNFEDDTMTIRLDFNNIEKIDKNELNLDNSFLFKSKELNDDSFLKYKSIFNRPNNYTSKETENKQPTTIAAHLPEGIELTEEEQKQLNDYIEFLLSRRKK